MRNLFFQYSVGVFSGILLLLSSAPSLGQEDPLSRFRAIRASPQLRAQLAAVVDVAVRRAFGEAAPLPEGLDAVFLGPMGVFVTAKRGDEVRGCMGSLAPKKGSLAEEIAANLQLAFFRDPRHRSIRREELAGMKIFLSATGGPLAIERWGSVSPARDAILLKSGAKEAVVLPGEARTQRYLLAFAKAKAGIKKGEAFRLYRLPVEVIEADWTAP
ncbi:MAG: AMMECR1 domain-containing protein [Deltaproteobacteria bacterium]|nr:AMMECR1 domain-containing protein [Deltaproteobacteria bacterium]